MKVTNQTQSASNNPLNELLQIKYIYGYKTDFKNNLFMTYDNKIIYPAGHNIIIYSSDSKTQSYIPCIEGSKGVTCMALSNSKKYLAYAEETKEVGVVHVIELQNTKKKKTFLSLDCKSTYFVSLCFDRKDENKFLVTLTGEPDWTVIYWEWSKPKPLAKYSPSGINKFYHITFNPKFEDACLFGNNTFRTLTYVPGNDTLKLKDQAIFKKEIKDQHMFSQNYISYCWLDGGYLVLGTDSGELLLFNANNYELKTMLSGSPGDGWAIECMVPYSRGFIVGGADGIVFIFEKNDGDVKNPYMRSDLRSDKKIQIPNCKSKIIALALNASEDIMIIGLDNGSMLQFPFNFDRNTDEPIKFDHVVQPFHTNRITGLDVCIRKALVVTCGLDKTVRVWNYIENTLDLMKEFEDEAHSVAFHPSGLHLAVGFTDKIRLINILINDLVPFKEINIKVCREIAFNNGGDKFAIANGTTIHVYNTYTGENPPNQLFRDHTGKIKQIYWHDDDSGFLSAGYDGNLFDWKIEDNSNPNHLLSQNQIIINSVTASQDKIAYATCSNSLLCEIKITKQENKESVIGDFKKKQAEPIKYPTGVNVSQAVMSHSNKFLFMSTSDLDTPGSIRILRYPLTSEVYEFQVHSKGIERMKITYNDTYLFTIGNDGILVVYEIRDKEARAKRDKEGGMDFSDEYLMSREKFLKKMKKIERLTQEIRELSSINHLRFTQAMKAKEDQINELKDQIAKEQAHEKARYDAENENKKKLEQKHEENKNQLRKAHEHTKKVIEADYKAKRNMEIQRCEEIKKEIEREAKEFEQFKELFLKNQQRIFNEKRAAFQQRIKVEQQEKNSLLEEKEKLKSDFEEKRESLEEETEKQIEDIKEKYEIEKKKIEDQMKRSEFESQAKHRELESEKTKIIETKSRLNEIIEEIKQINEGNNNLKKEREAQDKEIQERINTINEKTERIAELKKKVHELEKFKFVLDYKIRELKRDIGPREEDIAKMKEQINNMNAEILHFQRTNSNLKLIVNDLKLRQKGMKKEIENQNKTISDNNHYIKSFENAISECYQVLNDYKKLKQQVLALYEKYVQSDSKKFETKADIQKELINQRVYLESCIGTLKKKFSDNMQIHKQDNLRIMKENVELIKEINNLKREKKIRGDAKTLERIQSKLGQTAQLEALDKEIEVNDEEIKMLREQIEIFEKANSQLKGKPTSSGIKLPAIGGK